MEPIEERFRLRDLMVWDDEIYASIVAFRERHGCYPNVCCANERTLEMIDVAMNYHLLRDGLTDRIQSIGSFCWSKGEIEMAIDRSLDVGEYFLIYDDDPEFVEEPDEMEESVPCSIGITSGVDCFCSMG